MDIARIYNNVYLSHPVVTTDSRHCPQGSMFFALKGDRFDGNAYAATALEAGCAVAVVDDADVAAACGEKAILVDDVLTTLQELAAEHRRHFQGPVIQVTGTNGKTTTKELLAAVLARRYNVLYTQGNLNNHIGVPLTLLRLRPEHEVAIIETGANHPGEIAALTRIVKPDYGLVTNVGRAHLEGFGSFEGVKATKGELYDFLLRDGKVFVNGGDPDLTRMLEERGAKRGDRRLIVYGGEGDEATCRGEAAEESGAQVVLRWWRGGKAHLVETQLVGRYNVNNLLAAVAVGLHFGVAEEDIDAALREYTPSLGRSELKHTASNELIVDAYNANPTSMRAALDNFGTMHHEHKMLILGDMRELGADSEAEHRLIAEMVATSDAERIWLVGSEFCKAAEGLTVRPETELVCLPDVAAAKSRIEESRPTGMLILIKGSNGTRLHELPDYL